MGEVIALFIPGVIAVAVVMAVMVAPMVMQAIVDIIRSAME